MHRFLAVTAGMFVGCSVAVLTGALLLSDDLQQSDGLAPGFAWLIVFALGFLGTLAGGVAGWCQAPRFRNTLRELRDQLKPPGERDHQ